MLSGRPTLTKFIIEEQRAHGRAGHGAHGAPERRADGVQVHRVGGRARARCAARTARPTRSIAHGETQKKLDVIANDILLRNCDWGGELAAMVSEEMEAPYAIPRSIRAAGICSPSIRSTDRRNIDVNVSVGTIFSVLRAPDGVAEPTVAHFLQPGSKQVAAGYAIYGPADDARAHARARRARLHARSAKSASSS